MSKIMSRREWIELAESALKRFSSSAHNLEAQIDVGRFARELATIMANILRECDT